MQNSKQCALLFLRKNDLILLAMKKRGLGEGYWNGVGGKLEPGETIEQALVRETQEEISVTPTKFEKVAEFDFRYTAEISPWHMHVHAYISHEWKGEPMESNEMAPKWFNINELPYESMWEDDQYWLPLVIAGDKVSGTFEFDADQKLLSHELKTVQRFDV